MSDLAYEPDVGSVNIHGSALEPAEPVTTAFESETQAQPEPEINAERLAELENPYSPEFVEGYTQAKLEEGYEQELEPDDPKYVEWAQAQIEALREQHANALQAMHTVVEQSMEQGDYALAEYAQNLVNQIESATQQAEWERQAVAEERAAAWENAVETGSENIGQWIDETTNLVGADEVDPARVWEIATNAYGTLIETQGKEAADAAARDLIEGATVHASNEVEAGTIKSLQTAEELSKAFGGKADASEIYELAEELYPRLLFQHGGDQNAAYRAAMEAAAKTVAGVSGEVDHLGQTTGNLSQPLNGERSPVASFHATLARLQPQAEQPKPQVQMRDAKGRYISGAPVAAKYAAPAPKSDAEVRKAAQAKAIKDAFTYLGGNR